MKKALIILIPLLLIATWFVTRKSETVSTSENPQENIWKPVQTSESPENPVASPKNADPALKKQALPASPPALRHDRGEDFVPQAPRRPKERVLTEKEIEEMEAYFEKVEDEWDETIKGLFIGEMGMNEQDLKEYYKLRDDYEEQKLEAFQDFHESMQAKYGENYTYNPTDEELDFAKKIKTDHLDRLRKKIGEDNYIKYLDTIDKFNERLRREQDPDKGIMYIEF